MITPRPRLVSRALAVLLIAGVLAVAPSTTAYAVDPIPGPQTSGDTQFPNVGNGGYDVSDYDIDIVWTPATIPGVTNDQSIAATTTITAATTGAPLSSFSLDFEGLTLDSVTVDGVAATTSRVQNAAQTKYKLIVTPSAPVDGVFTTVVTYHGTPTAHEDVDGSMEGWNATSDGATFLNQPIGSMTGFPNNNTTQDKATYTFTINVPTTISGGAGAAVANGVLTSQTAVAGSRTVWVWDVARPMPSELSMISIGRYNMSTSDLDVAGVGVVKEWSFVDPTTTASTSFATTRAKIEPILEFLSARYGAYPGNSVGLVVDNVTGLGINYALETQDRPFFPDGVSNSTLTHELMHQWFGNNVSPEFWSDLWLSEGPATYSSAQYANESTTETTFYNQWNSTTGSTWTTPAANPNDTDPLDLYGSHVYARGAMALEALRTAVGPTDFLAIMAEWQDRYGGTSQGTEDFFALAEEISGEELTAFFQDWIYDANKPAWPGKFNLALATTPSAGPVAPGSALTYKVSVTNTGKVSLAGAVVTLDLTDVLDDASIGALPGGTSLVGNTLTWTVPTTGLGATNFVNVPFTIAGGTDGDTLAATARASTLGSTCTACTSSLAVLTNPVTPSAVPTIDDMTPKVGQSLTATPGAWDPAATLAYEWAANGTPVGTDSAVYAVQPADLGKTLTVTVTGSRGGFQPVAQTSLPTSSVAEGDQTLTPNPTITGTPEVGATLTAVPGTWDPGVNFTYQWRANDAAIAGATSSTYQPVAADIGRTIKVAVTGSRTGYVPATRVSNPTAAVTGSTLQNQTSTPTPTVVGPVRVGHTLSTATGSWDPGVALSYQWLGDGTAIPGATSASYPLAVADLGRRMSVTVTGTRAGFVTVSRTSTQTFPVAPGQLRNPPKPRIRGQAVVNSILKVITGAWPEGVRLKVQWYADGQKIRGATDKRLLLSQSMRGKRISVKITGRKQGYRPAKATSARTAPVV